MLNISVGITLRAIGALIVFFINYLVVSSLGVRSAADFFYIYTLTSIFSAVMSLGAYNLIMSRKAESSQKILSNYWGVSVFLLFPFSTLFLLACYTVGLEFEFIYIGMLANIFAAFTVVYSGYLNKSGKALTSIFYQNIFGQALFAIFLSLYIFGMDNYDSYSIVKIYVLSLAVPFAFSISNVRLSSISYRYALRVLICLMPFFIILLSSQFYTWGVAVVSMNFLTDKEYSALSIIQRIAFAIAIVVSVVDAMSGSKLNSAYRAGDFEKLCLTMKKFTFFGFSTGVFIFVFLLVFAGEILGVFSNELVIYHHELVLVCVAQIFNCSTGPTGNFFMMTGLQRMYKKLVLYSSFFAVLLAFFVVPLFGLLGASYVMLAASVFVNLFSVVFIRIKFGFWTFGFSQLLKK